MGQAHRLGRTWNTAGPRTGGGAEPQTNPLFMDKFSKPIPVLREFHSARRLFGEDKPATSQKVCRDRCELRAGPRVGCSGGKPHHCHLARRNMVQNSIKAASLIQEHGPLMRGQCGEGLLTNLTLLVSANYQYTARQLPSGRFILGVILLKPRGVLSQMNLAREAALYQYLYQCLDFEELDPRSRTTSSVMDQ